METFYSYLEKEGNTGGGRKGGGEGGTMELGPSNLTFNESSR